MPGAVHSVHRWQVPPHRWLWGQIPYCGHSTVPEGESDYLLLWEITNNAFFDIIFAITQVEMVPQLTVPSVTEQHSEKVAGAAALIPPVRVAAKESYPPDQAPERPTSARSAAAMTLEKEREAEFVRKTRLAEVALSNKVSQFLHS